MKLLLENWREYIAEEYYEVDALEENEEYCPVCAESMDEAKEEFKPHMMYDPKTGIGKKAEKYEDHVEMDKKGWVHEEPDIDEAKNKDGKEQGADGKACWKGKRYAGQDEDGSDICEPMEEADTLEEEPAKGKAKQKVTASGKKVSYGQAGKAKDGGPRVEPGTNKGDAYCARSMGIKKGLSKDKQNDPNTPNNLSRKRWKCSGEKSTKD